MSNVFLMDGNGEGGTVGPAGPAGPAGATGATGATGSQGPAGLSSSVFTYTFSDQTSGTPSSGHLFLNAVPAEATSLVVSHFDKPNNDIDVLLENVQVGSKLIVQRSNDSNTYRSYQVTSRTLSVGYVTYGLGYLIHAGSIANNDEVLLITQAQGIQGIQGPAGPAGASADLEYTFSQFSYYGSSATANPINLPTGTINHIGGSLTLQTQSGSSQLTKSYRNKSNVSSTANGALTGWQGLINSPIVFIGQGFKFVYSFGIEDTSTNALTRTLIGIQQGTTVNVLNNTTTVQSLTQQNICVMQESGESVFSFYTRGPSSFQKIATTVPCTTPSTLWYTLVIHNTAGSPDVTLTLTGVSLTETFTSTQTFTCGLTTTPTLTAANYVIIQRNMSSAGGVTGSGSLSLGGVKLYYR